MFQKEQLLTLLKEYKETSEGIEREYAERTIALVQDTPHFASRNHFDPGHVTASAFVVNQNKTAMLLTHHVKFDRWLQPGGHVEIEDETIFEAALREVHEETGVVAHLEKEEVFQIDIHNIAASHKEPAHAHFDIRIMLSANDNEALQAQEGESHAVRWFALEDIEDVNNQEAMQRALKRISIDASLN